MQRKSGQWHLGCERPRGVGMEREPPRSPGQPKEPEQLALSTFPPGYIAAFAPFQTPSGSREASRGRGPGVMRAAISLVGLVREGDGHPQCQVGPVIRANFGVPRLRSTPRSRILNNGDSKWGLQVYPGALRAVESPQPALNLTVLRSSGGGQGSARGAGGRRRGQPGPRRPPNGPARLQITPWLAAGAPAPARRRPLQLAAKFMLAALQWRPQSARSIPTARLRAARPEGGVSGV